jgi:hypothetical protein
MNCAISVTCFRAGYFRLILTPAVLADVVTAALALQAPLQPLQDNLESQTYETFEKDVTKYNCYQEAVRRALLDRVPAEAADSMVTVLMVVGAGRWGRWVGGGGARRAEPVWQCHV